MSSSIDTSLEEGQRKQEVMALSYTAGFQTALPSFAATATGVFYFFKTRPNFVKRFGFSAMSGLPLLVGIFSFVVTFEQTMYDAHRNPENYGLAPLSNTGELPRQSKL
jgi:hypothetical protein